MPPLGDAAAFKPNLAKENSGGYRDQQFLNRYSIAPSLAVKLTSDTDLLLQCTQAKEQRVADFGITALNGRPVNVPASTYYGPSRARDDETTHVSRRQLC